MNARIAISSFMDLQQASNAISRLPTNEKLHFKVKTDANGDKTLHVRPLSNTDKLKLKLTNGYSLAQKNAAFTLIKDIVDQVYPGTNAVDKTKPEVRNMLKLHGAILHNVSLATVEAGIRIMPTLAEKIDDEVFNLQSKINPSTLGKGLDY
jgi:hypothetical protein